MFAILNFIVDYIKSEIHSHHSLNLHASHYLNVRCESILMQSIYTTHIHNVRYKLYYHSIEYIYGVIVSLAPNSTSFHHNSVCQFSYTTMTSLLFPFDSVQSILTIQFIRINRVQFFSTVT